jgi:SAM-dependent methyltransferase
MNNFASYPHPSLPEQTLLTAQADWLAPARGRLFRRISIAHRQSVLDLGAGYGAVTTELARRSGGYVVPLDISHSALRAIPDGDSANIYPATADGRQLPFANNSFDLIFCQCSLMWMFPLESAVREIARTLQPGGVLIALEPDYGGLIEYPDELATRDLWLSALERAGAGPFTGRRLPALLAQFNMTTRITLLDELHPPSPLRFQFLRGLPLTPAENTKLSQVEQSASRLPPAQQIAHLPFFLITATKEPTT